MKKILLLTLLIFFSYQAQAVKVSITDNCSGAGNGGFGSQTLCEAFTDEIRSTLNGDLPDVSISKYASGVADATGFAMKGQNSDYSDLFTVAMIRGSVGGAVRGDISEPEKADGVGIGAAATLGVNLNLLPVDKIGFVELDKMDLFVSFMSFKPDMDIGDDTNIDGELSSFAVMARYQLMESVDLVPGYMVQWGGLHLHTGVQRNRMRVGLRQNFDDQTVSTGGATGTFQDTFARFKIDSTVTSIPVEISTSLRLAYVFTLFGGAGFDYNISSETEVDFSASGTASANSGDYTADIQASESGSGSGAATNFRGFAGIQFNVPFVRVYAQVNKGFGNDLIGANAGVKVLF